jgi:phosphoribosylglycinamide formyltransferase-1
MSKTRIPVVILISGRGSNLQSIIDAMHRDELDIDIKAVISNRPGAAGLDRARDAGIPAITIDHTAFSSRQEFEQALQQGIDQFKPQLVILAGFMRILGKEFVEHYLGRMLNIHPSLLPKYTGLNTHQRVLDNGDNTHGASIHFVTTELDGGPVVIQVEVPVFDGDNADRLASRVLQQEHRLYRQAIQWFAENRLQLIDGQVYLDGKKLQQPRILKAVEQDP